MALRRPSLWLLLLISAPVFALPEPGAEESEYQRKKFGVWRQYPEQLARLRASEQTFQALPKARQEQLLQLDHDLHQEASSEQARLHDALDRYNAWLGELGEHDRDAIVKAASKEARLQAIRDIKMRQWIARQPGEVRQRLAKLQGPARDKAVAEVRRDARQRRDEWATARRFWDDLARNKPLPSRPSELDGATQAYLRDVLDRLLSKEERDRLAKAEGNWPDFPRTLVELADKHPPALPSPQAPRGYSDLPKPVRDAVAKKGGPIRDKLLEKRLKPFEGRFPEFAIKFTSLASENGLALPYEWWVTNFNGLSPAMQEFVKSRLKEPLLDRKETRQLVDAEGKWPDYPETIEKLARNHHLTAPWFTLPPDRERWDSYRAARSMPTLHGFPEVPKYKLRQFALVDLDDLDRMKLKNEIERAKAKGDNEGWAYLAELFFQHYPSELARLRNIDRARFNAKMP